MHHRNRIRKFPGASCTLNTPPRQASPMGSHLLSPNSPLCNSQWKSLHRWTASPTWDLAGQAGAVEGEAVEGAENGDGDLAGLKRSLGEGLEFFASDGFDGSEDFVERVEASKIQFLAREIGHARAGGLEREHQRALEMILRAAQLFIRDR